jgi:hypothetical protein
LTRLAGLILILVMPAMPKHLPTEQWIHTNDLDPVGFFSDTYETFQKVRNKVGGPIDKYYYLHGHLICFSFLERALIPKLTRALTHWEVAPGGDPEFTICLWDDASTGTKMPPPPWYGYATYMPRGDIRGYNTERIRTAFQMGSDVLCTLDLSQNKAIYWTRNAEHLPQWEIGSPLRLILHWWLREQGLQLVHAGAVGLPDGGVLVVGKGGSGKSTTALTCLNSDLLYVSDDYCLVSADPVPTVYNLYNTGKVREDDIYRLPHLEDFISNFDRLDQEKALFFLNEVLPHKLIHRFPLRAVLIPTVTGLIDTTLSPAPATASLSALMLSTIKQLAGAGPAAVQVLKRLVEKLPNYYLELGTDLSQIPGTILDLLATLDNDQ